MTTLSVDTKLMAYIPKIMRPGASTLLDICFGMGTTFRSALQLGLRTDAVDLSPSVPRQMPVFYADAQQYLHSPLARIITTDGRNYVRLTSRRYDLITVDPPPPIEAAGAAVLYTQQFYADAHHALRPGGLMLQWLYFGVDLDQFREHLRTFRSVFPHVRVLFTPRSGGVYLLGSDDPIAWTGVSVSQFLGTPQAAADIADAPDSAYLPRRFLGGPAAADGVAAGCTDRPLRGGRQHHHRRSPAHRVLPAAPTLRRRPGRHRGTAPVARPRLRCWAHRCIDADRTNRYHCAQGVMGVRQWKDGFHRCTRSRRSGLPTCTRAST